MYNMTWFVLVNSKEIDKRVMEHQLAVDYANYTTISTILKSLKLPQ